jgi:hypothetical protein
MLKPFQVSADFMHWELTALGANGGGPYALVVRHARGTIVEYFRTTPVALNRIAELDDLLTATSATRPFIEGPR